MDHYKQVYMAHGDEYEELVEYEDLDGNLLKAMRAVAHFDDALVIDVGAGTGRVGRQMLDVAARVVAVDLHESMLRVAQRLQRERNASNWHFAMSDAMHLPFSSGWADVAIAGWMLGHFASWFSDHWQEAISCALDEMMRVMCPTGQMIIIETMGTGFESAAPPAAHLAAYYEWLENVRGFSRQIIRTDYTFPSVAVAAKSLGFFFGDELRQRVIDEQASQLIEWTGVWNLEVGG